FACTQCGSSFAEIEPRGFSFNNPQGACPTCNGLGTLPAFDPDLIVPNPSLSLREGAIAVWADRTKAWQERIFETLAHRFKFSLDTPWEQVPEKARQILLYGSGSEELDFGAEGKAGFYTFRQPFEGIIPQLEQQQKRATGSKFEEEELAAFVSHRDCVACLG